MTWGFLPPQNAHQFCLRERGGLEMQAAQGSASGGIGVVILNEHIRYACCSVIAEHIESRQNIRDDPDTASVE